jgi:Flp pilus assembly protein TadG
MNAIGYRFLKLSARRLMGETSGNAVMLVAVGIPALIGAAGLAVDFSQWYLWKRELQLATDQAAIAAAWARTDSHTRDTYTQRGTQDYHANLAITRDFASEPSFTLANYSNGTNNSVVVTATASKSLPFSSFMIGRGVTIAARSQASFAAGGNYSACLIATGSSGTTLSIGGNASVTAHCGMAALSCSDDAVVIDGSATVVTDAIATCGTASVPAALDGVVSENLGQGHLSDEFADLTPPTNDTPRSYSCSGHGQNAQASPLAGTYHGLRVTCRTTLGAGIYVIDGGTLDLTGNYAVTGTNVMFVLRNGATLQLGGSGNGRRPISPPSAIPPPSRAATRTCSSSKRGTAIRQARTSSMAIRTR